MARPTRNTPILFDKGAMVKTIILALLTIFALGASAQNASQLMEKYSATPKAHTNNFGGEQLQNAMRSALPDEEYQSLKGIKNIDLLLLEPNEELRENIVADLKSLDGYTIIRDFADKYANFTVYGKCGEDTVSDMLVLMKIIDKTMLVHVCGEIPTAEARNIVKVMVKPM